MSQDWPLWPEVPLDQERPKDLYVAETVSRADATVLKNRGWTVVDVRLLPSKTDGDRADSVKKWLEGVRIGSINADKDIIKIVELEARTYGLVGAKPAAVKTLEDAQTDEDVIASLLNFASAKKPHRRQVATKEKRRIYSQRRRRNGKAHGKDQGGHPLTAKYAPRSTLDRLDGAIALLDNL